MRAIKSSRRTGAVLCTVAFTMAVLLPMSKANACACGCGIFSVGANNLLPSTLGNATDLYLRFDYLDQSKDWHGDSSEPAAANPDKNVRTLFQTVGLQTFFNRNWGMRVELPYWQRHFATLDDTSQQVAFNHGALGDLRLLGVYTGFSPDRSTGLMFGAKLATGDWTYPGFDRDTAIGTGTTDVLLGGYRQWKFGANMGWGGFVQTMADLPTDSREGYRPGDELDAAAGVYPSGWDLGGGVRLTPILQVQASLRQSDSGREADPANSGYQRVLAAPSLEFAWSRLRIDATVAAPIWQHTHGYQLVAPWQASLMASWAL
ncbi:MAG: hypothetical protein KGJ94_07660 [Xanthomonadaceae bacterium]|nr:hypothetical protein [Xanthomonadaceae bacterium]